MTGHQNYLAYGLRLETNFRLPILPVGNKPADLIIRYVGLMEPLAQPPPAAEVLWYQDDSDWVWDYRKPDGLVLRFSFQDQGNFLSIYYSQPEKADIFPFLLGAGLGTALHLRGVPLLHGAAVVIRGNAVLVSGHSGMGKSTLTAMLVRAGLPLLTEDLAPLKFSDHEFFILPGYPGLQLHADAVQRLDYSLVSCPPVYPGFPLDDKHWLDITRLAGGFHPTPAPLRVVYILTGRRPDLLTPQVTTLSPTQACLALLDNLYGTLWLNIPPQQTLSLCARLAERVQVRRVWTPEGLDTVAATAQALMADAQASGLDLT